MLDDLDAIPAQYRGVHPGNPINRPGLAGVQVELTPRVRGTSPIWEAHDFSAERWVPHTAALIEALVASAEALAEDGHTPEGVH